MLKLYSYYVLPGAKRIETSGYDNLLAFRNLDGSIVITAGNLESQDKPIKIKCGDKEICPTLPANSVNTFLIQADSL